MVKLTAGPVHPFNTGVIVIIAVIVADVVLSAVNVGISPDPLAGSPMAVLELVQV